jgi:predicted lysophospholipase L1 biosynthesis ABC-type transport system permease subunit
VGGSAVAVYVLMGAAGLVLLIACLNVGNLFLVRAITQGRDSAIRAALGAARSRVMGQRLLECVLVAGFGGVIGAVVAHWGVRFLLAVSPESLARAEDVGFDTGLLAFAVVLTRAPACSSVSARPTARHGRTRAWPCTTALAGRRLGVVAVTRAPRSSWPRWPLRSAGRRRPVDPELRIAAGRRPRIRNRTGCDVRGASAAGAV